MADKSNPVLPLYTAAKTLVAAQEARVEAARTAKEVADRELANEQRTLDLLHEFKARIVPSSAELLSEILAASKDDPYLLNRTRFHSK